ncbi:hypothetical protein LG204_00250 [Methylovorus menthalis]|uniref:hypothetical protein n=1 Tax=Methylovorus menthalis TaxID=1002227 RepID=UPI001E2DC25F|nr:hypothetical protein [Methylovorus menthalis]MCB4809743.1 hypothetical protein [Methylovorus menthalis]
MHFSKLRLLVAVIILGLCGCIGPQLYHQQLSFLNKGMSPTTTIDQLKQSPRYTQLVDLNGRSILFHQYLLNSGVQIDQYFLAFENNQLIYWGFITEFRRQPDQTLSEALSVALARQATDKK